MQMRQPALARGVPMAIGAIVLIAGAVQFTGWKARLLACCRKPSPVDRADVGAAWRYGVRLGFDCCRCCAGPMAILLVVGVMDLRVTALVTAAITAERLAPDGERAARAVGVVAIGVGVWLIARAVGLG
jgi:predicted metal-binding membrane protein